VAKRESANYRANEIEITLDQLRTDWSAPSVEATGKASELQYEGFPSWEKKLANWKRAPGRTLAKTTRRRLLRQEVTGKTCAGSRSWTGIPVSRLQESERANYCGWKNICISALSGKTPRSSSRDAVRVPVLIAGSEIARSALYFSRDPPASERKNCRVRWRNFIR